MSNTFTQSIRISLPLIAALFPASFIGMGVGAIGMSLSAATGIGMISFVGFAVVLMLFERHNNFHGKSAALQRIIDDLEAQHDFHTTAAAKAIDDLTNKKNVILYNANEQATAKFEDYASEAKRINGDLLVKVEELESKIYNIDLNCSYCGNATETEFDLGAGDYVCPTCGNVNAVHTSIFTARTSEPLVDMSTIPDADSTK